MTPFNGRIAENTTACNKPVSLLPRNPGTNLLTAEEWDALAHKLHLSTREVAVATLLLLGETRKRIASLLEISPETVRVHLEHLFQKCQVRTSRMLVLRIANFRTGIAAATLPA